jgi:hypothetical protein
MPFGKYAGIPMISVPADYLLWLYDKRKFTRDLRIYIEDHLDVLKMQAKEIERRKKLESEKYNRYGSK